MEDVVGGDTEPRRWENIFGKLKVNQPRKQNSLCTILNVCFTPVHILYLKLLLFLKTQNPALMLKLLLTFIILIFLVPSALTQLPDLQWAKSFEKSTFYASGNNGRTIGVDDAGNVYSSGRFEYTMDMDPGPGFFLLSATGQFNSGFYISKLDSNGNFVWAKQIPALLEFSTLEMKVDRLGNIYIATDTRAAADLDPGAGVQTITPTGFRDVIIIKLNSSGDYIWGKQIGGPGDTGPTAAMIELDQNNNVIVAGQFNNTVDFDPGAAVYNLTSSAHFQAFVVKLDNNGNFIWAKQFGNGPLVYSGSQIYDMKCDAGGNIVLTGRFSGACDFDPGTAVHNESSSAGSIGDGFICKLDADFNFIWVKTVGQVGGNNMFLQPLGIDIDGWGNIITTGYFIGNFDFDPGAGTLFYNSRIYDCYILKLNNEGTLVWAKIIGGSVYDMGHDVVVDKLNNIYMLGSFSPTVDFDPGPGVHSITSPNYGAHALVKLNAAGNFVYAATFPDLNNYAGSGIFRRMVIDPSKNIYITGYCGQVDLDPGPGIYSLPGASDPFVLKLGPCANPTSATLNINACYSYILNGETFDTTGTYVQTIPNSLGCDSVITLHLTINKKTNEKLASVCDGEKFYAGGAMQTTSGIYYDTLQTSLGCDSVVITTLKVHPSPIPLLGDDKSLCNGTQALISPGTFTQYLWQDMTSSNNFVVSSPGLYWVKVTNGFNCSSADSIRILTVLPSPDQFLKTSDSICNYQTLEIAAAKNFNQYLWSTGAAVRQATVISPGIYWLTVTDANGCTGTDTISIYPKICMSGVYIPTAFTPNHDGLNDFFKATVFGKLLSFRLQVFNREGQLIFQTTDPHKSWDGSFAGLSYSTAAFAWQCSYQLENQQPALQKGTVAIIK